MDIYFIVFSVYLQTNLTAGNYRSFCVTSLHTYSYPVTCDTVYFDAVVPIPISHSVKTASTNVMPLRRSDAMDGTQHNANRKTHRSSTQVDTQATAFPYVNKNSVVSAV